MNESATNPLESFLRDYMETSGGLWDQVEPQVYDLMLPEVFAADSEVGPTEDGMVRVAFDPEAVPEHPGSQLMSFGTPLLDQVLSDAQQRARFARAFVVGLNLHPADLGRQLRRSLDLGANVELALGDAQAVCCPILVHWFCATYVSDQKEQDTFVVAVDSDDGHQVRQLDRLLDSARLYESAVEDLPDVSRKSNLELYGLARDRVVRSVCTTAHARRRELAERGQRQKERMVRYYRDLRAEVEQQIARALKRGEDTGKIVARRLAIDREEKLRVAELETKSTLRVHLRLLNLLEIRQPKLRIESRLTRRLQTGPPRSVPGRSAAPQSSSLSLVLTWNPLIESLEAPRCPSCDQPTFAVRIARRGDAWSCASCARPSGPTRS